MALTMEMAGAGELNATIKEKMRNQVQGKPMPLVRSIRPEKEQGTMSWLYNQAKQVDARLAFGLLHYCIFWLLPFTSLGFFSNDDEMCRRSAEQLRIELLSS